MRRKRDYSGKESKIGYAAALLGIAFSFTACGSSPEDSSRLLILEKEPEALSYSMAEAVIEDVVQTEQISCTYRQTEEQEVSFSVSGRQISRIYVSVGDSVTKGQLLAELVSDGIEERIEELEYRIARNSLLLGYMKINEDYEISSRWLQFLYQSGKTKEEEEALKASISLLQQNNQFQREDYQDAVELDSMELEELKKEEAASRVYARLNGLVTWVKQNMEGSTCSKDEVLIRIINPSEGVFVVEGEEYAELFQEDVPVELEVSFGAAAGSYRLLPSEMEKWGEQLTFTLSEQEEAVEMEAGTTGILNMVLHRREGVLAVPVRAIHMAEERYYVYVLGENNLRQVRWVETGLFGDENVEITKGLERGEKVILK